MLGVDADKNWKKFGQTDPYFSVSTDEPFHGDQWANQSKTDFFKTGERYVGQLFEVVRTQLVPGFAPRRGLDFGCGVARVAIPLARQCRELVAVDISEGMLEEARNNCQASELTNVEFALSDDRLSRVSGTFDFIHSFIVLQHIPPSRGLMLAARLIDRLEPGGVGVIHLTYGRRASRARKLAHWARQKIPFVNMGINLALGMRPMSPMMQMNAYNLSTVFRLLQEKSCHNVLVRFSDHGGWLGVVLMFTRQALDDF